MKTPCTHRFRNLAFGAVIAAWGFLCAPAAAAQPDDPADPTSPISLDNLNNPANPASPLAPDNPFDVGNIPQAPNDIGCIAQPGMGVCQGGPYDPLPPDGAAIPGMPSF